MICGESADQDSWSTLERFGPGRLRSLGEPQRVIDYCSQFRNWKTRANRQSWKDTSRSSFGKKDRKKRACLFQKAIVKRGVIGGSFGTNIEGPCATGDVRDKAGGGLDIAGSADGQEDSGIFESSEDFVQMKWRLAEPTDVGTYLAAAGTER